MEKLSVLRHTDAKLQSWKRCDENSMLTLQHYSNKACRWVIYSRKTVHFLLRMTVNLEKKEPRRDTVIRCSICSKDISPTCDKSPTDCYFCVSTRAHSTFLCSNIYCLSWCERLDLQPTRLTQWRATLTGDLYLLGGYNARVEAAQNNCSTLV